VTEAAPAGAGQQPLRALLVGLTFITGMVDAVTYIGLGHVFAANMTGNVVLLGFALVRADQVSVGASLLSLVAFLVGAALGGRLVGRLQPVRDRWLMSSLTIEAGLLAAAALWALVGASLGTLPVVGLLALAMGLRNATVRETGTPELTTTVLTRTLADFAVFLPARNGLSGAQARRLAGVFALLLGAAAGALLLDTGGLTLAIGATLGLLVLESAAYILTVQRTRSVAPAFG
jgi:uncharacterized membrane protein YoaK (UPF0700 family)